MKRGFIFLILFLLICPIVSATITLNNPSQSAYNLGDKITPTGALFTDVDLEAYLTFSIICDNATYQLQSVKVNAIAGEQLFFPNDFTVPFITLSSSMAGTCYIQTELVSENNEVLGASSTQTFQVTKELSGIFDIPEQMVQIGSDMILQGTVTKINDEGVTGSAELYFNQNDSRYLIDIIDFSTYLNYVYTATPTTPGKYDLDIFVRDIYGNEQWFLDAASFTLVDELYVFFKTMQGSVEPGESLYVFGEVKTILQNPLPSGTIQFHLGSDTYTTNVEEGVFEYTFNIPTYIKSGTQTLYAEVTDEAGNSGTADLNINIIAQASEINLTIENTEVMPGKELKFSAVIYDQANDEMGGQMAVYLFDPDDELMAAETAMAGEEMELAFPTTATPGIWHLQLTIDDVTERQMVTVGQLTQLSVTIDNQTLFIENVGNMKYKDNIEILFDSGIADYSITKHKSLDVGEILEINMPDEIPSGVYTVTVADQKFNDVEIIGGKSHASLDWIYTILLIFFILFLFYMGIKFYMDAKKGGRSIWREIFPRKKDLRRSRFQRHKIKKEEPHNFSKKRIGAVQKFKDKLEHEKSLKDFRDRILKDIKKVEEKEKKIFNSKKAEFNIPNFEPKKDVETKPWPKKVKDEAKPVEGAAGFFSNF